MVATNFVLLWLKMAEVWLLKLADGLANMVEYATIYGGG
jgi:hypothetical protein